MLPVVTFQRAARKVGVLHAREPDDDAAGARKTILLKNARAEIERHAAWNFNAIRPGHAISARQKNDFTKSRRRLLGYKTVEPHRGFHGIGFNRRLIVAFVVNDFRFFASPDRQLPGLGIHRHRHGIAGNARALLLHYPPRAVSFDEDEFFKIAVIADAVRT